MKTCPFCAEEIQDAAVVCRYCSRDVRDVDIDPRTMEPRRRSWGLPIALALVVLGVGGLWFSGKMGEVSAECGIGGFLVQDRNTCTFTNKGAFWAGRHCVRARAWNKDGSESTDARACSGLVSPESTVTVKLSGWTQGDPIGFCGADCNLDVEGDE